MRVCRSATGVKKRAFSQSAGGVGNCNWTLSQSADGVGNCNWTALSTIRLGGVIVTVPRPLSMVQGDGRKVLQPLVLDGVDDCGSCRKTMPADVALLKLAK